MNVLKALLLSLVFVAGVAVADSSHYYDPENPGHGVSKTHDSGQGSSFTWYLYDREGNPTWLISTSNCMSYPCDIKLATAVGTWMGGEVELVEVGDVTVDFIDGNMVWDYDVQYWPQAGHCGRMIWTIQTKCVGEFEMLPLD